jgi:hypothetical protein
MAVHTLTQLQHSQDRQGPWKLYIYEPNSEYHRGGVWFRKVPKYPDEEIPLQLAFEKTDLALHLGREIRICDGGDMLVYHAKGGKVLYGEKFWEEVA